MIFRDFEQRIIKDINESGMSIDAVYFIMKNIMREIEEKYVEYCRLEDMKKEQEEKENITLIKEEEDIEGTN